MWLAERLPLLEENSLRKLPTVACWAEDSARSQLPGLASRWTGIVGLFYERATDGVRVFFNSLLSQMRYRNLRAARRERPAQAHTRQPNQVTEWFLVLRGTSGAGIVDGATPLSLDVTVVKALGLLLGREIVTKTGIWAG